MNENTKNSIKTIGFEFPTEGNWVYESPDGGQTIYRTKLDDNVDDMEKIREKAPLIANIMEEHAEQTISEIDMLRQQVLNLTMANSELKDMLRQQGVTI
jgi:hypothetical protein